MGYLYGGKMYIEKEMKEKNIYITKSVLNGKEKKNEIIK